MGRLELIELQHDIFSHESDVTPARPTNTNLQLLPVHHPGAFQFANRDLTVTSGWGGLRAACFQSRQGAMCLVVMLHTKGNSHIRECSFFPPSWHVLDQIKNDPKQSSQFPTSARCASIWYCWAEKWRGRRSTTQLQAKGRQATVDWRLTHT